MKIGFKHFYPFSPFFVNLARYLDAFGHEVVLLNPQRHVEAVYSGKVRSVSYSLDSAEAAFDRERFDRLVVWNGIADMLEINQASRTGTTVWFAENGCFPGTLQLNKSGVNASADYAQLTSAGLMDFFYPEIELPDIHTPGVSQVHFPISAYMDHLLHENGVGNQGVFWRLHTSIQQRFAKLVFQYVPDKSVDLYHVGPYILFPLQVNADTQISQHSPYRDMYQILDMLVPLIRQTKYKLIIKAHPSEIQLTHYRDYADDERVIYVKRTNLDELIEQADVIITVNSSVGMQAAAKGKKVLTLGSSMYEQFTGVLRCNLHHDAFLDKLGQLESMHVNQNLNERLGQHFRDSVFLSGWWQSPSPSFLRACVQRITAPANQ